MLHKRDLVVGQCYVNNERKIARKVLAVDDGCVKFITYHLDTGNSSDSPSECTVQDFKHWADHEASPTEKASLKSHELEAMEHSVTD